MALKKIPFSPAPPIREKDKIIGIIRLFVPHATIYLFGSYARNDARAGSDIDLAIDAGEPLGITDVSRIKNMIEALSLPQNTDVVDMHLIPQSLLKRIKEEGIIWYRP